jgi:hypothetical protein
VNETEAPRLVAAVMWRGDDGSAERCRLEEVSGRPRVNGVVVSPVGGMPTEIRYVITLDETWRTTACHVVVIDPERTRRLHLHAAGDGGWHDDSGAALEALRGCTDVDLGVTPATNTLPIRRLGLAVGESSEIRAAWIRFPELTIAAAGQHYTREAERRWRYRSNTFEAELDVDERGIVLRYGQIWNAVARWPQA